jgi:hypothetical protein
MSEKHHCISWPPCQVPHIRHEPIFRDSELRVSAKLQVIRAVLGGGGEFGPEHEIADHHLRTTLMIALVRALDDGTKRTALIGIL